MGQFQIVVWTGSCYIALKMNRFISFFALLAVASAAPASKSDADAAIHILGRAPIIGVGGLTTYANGAQVPTDTPAVAAATAQHLAVKGTPILQDVAIAPVGYAGYGGWPYSHYIGKREAESEADPAIYIAGRAPVLSVGHLTTYANGAVVPTDTPAVAAATAQHLAAKGTPILQDVTVAAPVHYGYAGRPYAHYLGKREADSDADAYYGVLGYGYGLQHVPAVTSVGGLTTYSNGAVVPTDPIGLAATSAHLNEKAAQAARNILG